MEGVGLILASVLGLVIALIAGWVTGSVIVGIVVFILGAGYLYGQWMEASMPYNVNEIKKKLDDKE